MCLTDRPRRVRGIVSGDQRVGPETSFQIPKTQLLDSAGGRSFATTRSNRTVPLTSLPRFQSMPQSQDMSISSGISEYDHSGPSPSHLDTHNPAAPQSSEPSLSKTPQDYVAQLAPITFPESNSSNLHKNPSTARLIVGRCQPLPPFRGKKTLGQLKVYFVPYTAKCIYARLNNLFAVSGWCLTTVTTSSALIHSPLSFEKYNLHQSIKGQVVLDPSQADVIVYDPSPRYAWTQAWLGSVRSPTSCARTYVWFLRSFHQGNLSIEDRAPIFLNSNNEPLCVSMSPQLRAHRKANQQLASVIEVRPCFMR